MCAGRERRYINNICVKGWVREFIFYRKVMIHEWKKVRIHMASEKTFCFNMLNDWEETFFLFSHKSCEWKMRENFYGYWRDILFFFHQGVGGDSLKQCVRLGGWASGQVRWPRSGWPAASKCLPGEQCVFVCVYKRMTLLYHLFDCESCM